MRTESRSLLSRRDDQHFLDLVAGWARTPDGLIDDPEFFSGSVVRPDVVAAGILTVADVAGTTYADLSHAAVVRRNLDPIVTASGDRLRFESFSRCNGVYARFDMLPDGLDGATGFGTTNVDINQPLRAALAGVSREGTLRLSVGAAGLQVETPNARHAEDAVNLPERWVRGLAEVPSLLRGVRPVASLRGAVAARFLNSLPRVVPGPTLTLGVSPRGLSPTLRSGPRTVTLAGAGRLAALARVAHRATSLDVWAGPTGCSAWSLELPGGRLLLFLTPSPWRGFSGEGSLLQLLATDRSPEYGHRLLEWLAWEPLVDRAALGRSAHLSSDQVDAGLAWLAASGRVGYDLAEGEWFHRELPLDSEDIIRSRHPRLVAARRLIAAGAVTAATPRPSAWQVVSKGEVYDVAAGHAADPDRMDALACTCRWMAEHGSGRGPCKHILAVQLSTLPAESAFRGGPDQEAVTTQY